MATLKGCLQTGLQLSQSFAFFALPSKGGSKRKKKAEILEIVLFAYAFLQRLFSPALCFLGGVHGTLLAASNLFKAIV